MRSQPFIRNHDWPPIVRAAADFEVLYATHTPPANDGLSRKALHYTWSANMRGTTPWQNPTATATPNATPTPTPNATTTIPTTA